MRRQPKRLVFIDETSVKTNLTRLRGRAPRGQRLMMDAPFGDWGTQTFIAGLSHDALIAPWIIKGAMDGPAFAAYVREVLMPELAPGTVVILDNLATHRNVEAAEALRQAGCWFLYEGAIDFGAHPNLKGVASHLSIDENRPDGMTAVTLTSLYGSARVETVRGLCACLDFGFAIIGMIALATPDPGEDRVKRLIEELQALNDLKNDAIVPYQRPE